MCEDCEKSMYKKVSTDLNFVEREKEVIDFWNKNEIFKKSIKNREGYPTFMFYDGPPTANGKPHIGHIETRVFKDVIPRFWTMKGYEVPRKAGWDTHGLPVELEVEKMLGINGKPQIEKYGVEPFIKKCKESVWKYKHEWERMSERVGFWADMENPYVTYHDDYIESEWWALKTINDKGLLYKGHKIVPYCPRCGTALSSHEVAQGYKDVKETSCIAKFKVKNEENTYILAWTTTPWTLPSNVALCVSPKDKYVEIKVSNGEKYILAEALVSSVIKDEYEVIRSYIGDELYGTEYEPLYSFAKLDKKAYYVVADSYVTLTDGTGVVHIAPAFGEDDSRVGRDNDLPFLQLVDEAGKFSAETGEWAGTFVKDADKLVLKDLEERGLLFAALPYEHSYPFCWRCDTPLLYYAIDTWFIKMSALRDRLVANNNTVNWMPENIKEGRFGNFLENVIDWGLSRSRYWGTPLPVWECECGHYHVIGSREELKELGDNVPDNVELHKPYLDGIKIKCEKCGKDMTRVPYVIDCWFDSGSMPFAQYHYPFENKELFESQFPADFIAEGVDQTRGWFYVLLVISTIISGTSSFKNVVVNDMMLDKNGKKMSKSTGNIIDPIAIMEKYGADSIRWYMLYASPVWTPLKFDEDGVKEVYSKFVNPLKNTYSFFQMYANVDNINIKECNVDYSDREEIDKWLLSKYNNLVKNVRNSFSEYDLNKVTKYITSFVSDDLSNWYIRRNRNRFWGSQLNNSKKSVYMTTYEVLSGLCKLIAPIAPFVSEEIYTNLTGEKSVHLASYPVCNENLINPSLEEKMDLVRDLISIGRYAREENKIKVRQPLSEVLIDGKYESIIDNLTSLIKEELNVKEVKFINDINTYMNFEVKPNFKEAGKVFGKNMKAYQEKLLNLTEEELESIQKGESITLNVSGENYEVTPSLVDIRYNAKEGFDIGMDNGKFVILNAVITDSLKKEGNAREFVSKVQAIRKESNFDIDNRIKIYVNADEEFASSIKDNLDYVKNETLAIEINFDDSIEKDLTLNDYSVGIKLERVA